MDIGLIPQGHSMDAVNQLNSAWCGDAKHSRRQWVMNMVRCRMKGHPGVFRSCWTTRLRSVLDKYVMFVGRAIVSVTATSAIGSA
jgi:hypothetical protein